MRIWRKNPVRFTMAILILTLAACAQMQPDDQAGAITPVVTTPLAGLDYGPVARITIAEAVNSGFGEAVDVSGDTVVVGATDWNVGSGDQYGSVYVYQRAGGEWKQQARLMSSDGQDGFQYDQHFGRSVAIEGDVIMVGAPDAD